jgi:hypothetical protein
MLRTASMTYSGKPPVVACSRSASADLCAPGGVEGGRRGLDRLVAQPVCHRGQRQPPRCPEALGARDHRALRPGRGRHLGHQAGLADARPTADQRQTGVSRHRGPPHVPQQGELGGTAEELRRRRPRPAGPVLDRAVLDRAVLDRAAPDGAAPGGLRWSRGRAGVSHQALEELVRHGARDHAELALEYRGAMVVGADGASPVARVGLQLHQGAVTGLLQRLQLDPAARGVHRPGQVTAWHLRLAQQIAQVHALPLDLRPGLEYPVVVHAGEQAAPVRGDRAGRVPQDPVAVPGGRGGQGRLPRTVENAHVDTACPGVVPAQVPGCHDQRGLVSQHLTQVVQLTAQVGARLRVTGFRPEQARDARPGLR